MDYLDGNDGLRRTLPDPAAMTMAELRTYDLHYQHLVILGRTLTAPQRAHFAAVVARFCALMGGAS